MADDLPRCAANAKGECPRSDTVLLKEADDYWVFGCLTCKGVRVMTKPSGRERAKMEVKLQRQRQLLAWKRERRYFV